MRATTNPELTAAWATVPDVAKAQERHEAAVKLRRDFPRGKSPAEALADVQAEAVATFADTGKWPSTFAKDAAKAHADALVWESEFLALRRLEDVTKDAAEFLRDSLSADVLEHLDGRLSEILEAVKSAGETLDDVTTAEQAIDEGGDVLDAWRRLTSLLKDYRNVRAAQWDVINAVSGEDERARMRMWRTEGHGEIRGVRTADVPSHILDVIRSGAYDVEFLVWVAQSGTGYVPASYGDLEAEVTASTEPVAYDDHGPLVDLSPRVLPPLNPRPAQTYAHSRTPHLDASQPSPERPRANASAPDRDRSTTDYF
ncbi:hypothetical protein [Streptomyces purpurascens]|uniref:hypothetical protein n=1 Tax=Streptomyces purpurascens TaxID=1924 RepID=UPI0016768F7A|nr:hypothetical protein [Streptomyces purpurascens]MCE7050643.1 hypothetical protein [Streptomyces purpurascens]GHA35532.1 hypothetical protein GCM10010303_52860 [Streptomyces purpurascens]